MNTRQILAVFVLSSFIGITLYSCSPDKNKNNSDQLSATLSEEMKQARNVVETVCQNCHSPSASLEDRIAPPLELAKRMYLAATDSVEEDFVNKVVDFVLYPTEEQSVLHEEVGNYGIMDPIGYSKEEITNIALFIYRYELERPEWLDN